MPVRKTTKRRTTKGKGDYRGKARNFVRGKGDFFSDIVGAGAGALDKLLGGVPRSLANRAGKFVGRGNYRSKNFVRGKGDYSTSMKLAPPNVPMFGTSGRHNYLTYREYLGDVYSSVDFSSTVFNINAGLGDPSSNTPTCAGVFPWLANQAAQSYEQYKIKACLFEFISTSSDAVVSGATTSSLGQVVIATEYNTNRTDYTNLSDALNSQYATSQKPSINFTHPIECEPREKSQSVHYIRSGPVPSGSDILQYDIAKTSLITQGMPADGEVIGQLWISYKVELYKPILISQAESQQTLFAHYSYDNTNSDVTSAHIFGTNASNMVQQPGSNMALTFGTSNNSVAMESGFTSGNFMIWTEVYGTSATLTNAYSYASYGNCSPLYLNYGANTRQLPAGTASNTQFSYAMYTVTGPNATIIYGSSVTLPTSVTRVNVMVLPINIEAAFAPERKFGNFWRPKKGKPTAPWLRGKKAPKDPRRHCHQEVKEEEESQSDSEEEGPLSRHGEEDLLTALLIKRQRRRQVREEEDEDETAIKAKEALRNIKEKKESKTTEAPPIQEEPKPTAKVTITTGALSDDEEYVRVPKKSLLLKS